jgi:hypothetical protein
VRQLNGTRGKGHGTWGGGTKKVKAIRR